MKTKIALAFMLLLSIGLVYLFTYVPPLSVKHGIIETQLYLGDQKTQPLVVAFGGGGGGNDWSRAYMKGKRDTLNQKGYAVLAVGYFNATGTPTSLDRISLDAISDSILQVANHPNIDASNIVLIGGSKGGELILNLASRFTQYKAVIAMSTSNVTFPALTWAANTSCWTYQNEAVPYVPAGLNTISPALKGDLYSAHALMLEDEVAVKNAEIPVEHINGPVLLISGEKDNQWPASEMSDRIIERLESNSFKHYYTHVILNGGHVAPLEQFHLVYDFLEEHVPVQ
ncbi:MAG: acyl-CoA thioester hydrolase/BAAT C-terminal domain-containing protein [Saprospiraceae bacterium]